MESQNVSTFYTDDLEGYLSETVARAEKHDEALRAARRRVSACKDRIPKLMQVLDAKKPVELSLDECSGFVEYLHADSSLAAEECRICYMRGLMDGVEMKKLFE